MNTLAPACNYALSVNPDERLGSLKPSVKDVGRQVHILGELNATVAYVLATYVANPVAVTVGMPGVCELLSTKLAYTVTIKVGVVLTVGGAGGKRQHRDRNKKRDR